MLSVYAREDSGFGREGGEDGNMPRKGEAEIPARHVEDNSLVM
jgi:hypothetical protein